MSLLNVVPRGWKSIRVGEVLTLVNGRAFKPEEWSDTGLPIIRIQNLNDPDASFNRCDASLPDKFLVKRGDLLFAWSGTPGTSFGAHIWNGDDAWLNQHIFKVQFDVSLFDKQFLCYAINQNLATYINAAHGGAGLAHITKGKFEESELLVAPRSEQKRIVAKIEELFSEVDAGVSALGRAKANLTRYRAVVLRAAFEGKLTAEWRKKHPNVEPASKLLERILAKRREKWEGEERTRLTAASKPMPTNWREKYQEPTPPDDPDLPQLPNGWLWTRLEALSFIVGGITKGQKQSDGKRYRELPYLRVANVQRGYLDISEIKTIPATDQDLQDLELKAGDILFNEGGDRDKLGRGWVWEDQIQGCIHQNHVFRARPVLPELESRFISHHGNTFGKLWFQRAGKQSVNLA